VSARPHSAFLEATPFATIFHQGSDCQDRIMTKRSNGAGVQRQVLGRKTFEAITAVEGLKLSAAGRRRISGLSAGALTPDQRRAAIVKAYKGQKGDK